MPHPTPDDLAARIDAVVRVVRDPHDDTWEVYLGTTTWLSTHGDARDAEQDAARLRADLRGLILGPVSEPPAPRGEPDAPAVDAPLDVLIDDAVIAVDRLYERTTRADTTGPAWARAARLGARAVAVMVLFTHAVGAARRAERER
jgi:hypothetical protein